MKQQNNKQALEFSSKDEEESEKYYCPLCKEVHFWSNICIQMLEYSEIFDWLEEGLGQPDIPHNNT